MSLSFNASRVVSTHMDVIETLLPLREGLALIDVGCGDGSFAIELASKGVNALGVESDPTQAARNRELTLPSRVQLCEAHAQRLPADDQSVDAVIFMYSFHHIPISDMPQALDESRRVLKPGGILLICEPVAAGPMQEVMKHFHDETLVRREAILAMEKHATPFFSSELVINYATQRHFRDFEAFASHYAGLSYNSHYTKNEVYADVVRQAFEQARVEDGYQFDCPVRINRFQ